MYPGKIKAKVNPEHAMKALRGSSAKLYFF
jgi:hypothetical protein